MFKKIKTILYVEISDWVIFVGCFIFGFWLVSNLFVSDMNLHDRSFFESMQIIYQKFPLLFAAIYLFFKALISDYQRIIKGLKIQIPGAVFLSYAFQWWCMWLSYDILFNTPQSRLGTTASLGHYFLVHPLIAWIIVDGTTEILLSIIKKRKDATITKFARRQLQNDYSKTFSFSIMRSFFSFAIVVLISLVFSRF